MSPRTVLGLAAAWIVVTVGTAYFVAPHWFDSDKDRFDQLQIGMTHQEVNHILWRPQRAAAHEPLRSEYHGLEFGGGTRVDSNSHMKLVFENGRLVEKTWTE
jgi:hypothetical protein